MRVSLKRLLISALATWPPSLGAEVPVPDPRPPALTWDVALPVPRPDLAALEVALPDPRGVITVTAQPLLPAPRLSDLSAPSAAPSAAPSQTRNPQQCLSALRDLGVTFQRASRSGAGGCGVADGVEVAGFDGVRLRPPGLMTCAAALATAQWLNQSVLPEARARFRQEVQRLDQVSTYACRTRPGGKLSEHATGNAIDLAGLELADGTVISVLDDWYQNSRRGQFLKTIARSACTHFSLVLAPWSDAQHQDHFHLDMGAWRSCDG